MLSNLVCVGGCNLKGVLWWVSTYRASAMNKAQLTVALNPCSSDQVLVNRDYARYF